MLIKSIYNQKESSMKKAEKWAIRVFIVVMLASFVYMCVSVPHNLKGGVQVRMNEISEKISWLENYIVKLEEKAILSGKRLDLLSQLEEQHAK